MTIVRAKIDMNIPRKRKGFCGQHDKVSVKSLINFHFDSSHVNKKKLKKLLIFRHTGLKGLIQSYEMIMWHSIMLGKYLPAAVDNVIGSCTIRLNPNTRACLQLKQMVRGLTCSGRPPFISFYKTLVLWLNKQNINNNVNENYDVKLLLIGNYIYLGFHFFQK